MVLQVPLDNSIWLIIKAVAVKIEIESEGIIVLHIHCFCICSLLCSYLPAPSVCEGLVERPRCCPHSGAWSWSETWYGDFSDLLRWVKTETAWTIALPNIYGRLCLSLQVCLEVRTTHKMYWGPGATLGEYHFDDHLNERFQAQSSLGLYLGITDKPSLFILYKSV